MKLLVGTQAGFCFGVRKAVDAVEERLGGPGKIFMLGPVINNPRVVSSFEERGVRVVMSPEEIDEADATVIIRSHGVPPAWIEAVSARFDVLDLTCPHVMRAQKIVSEADGAVIIAGEAGHPEVVGLCGCCENTYVVLELSDVDALPSMEKATLISQTTLSLERFGIIREAVSRKVRELDVHNTICGATSKRREEARGLSSRADAMIVVGGRTSSNTLKLYELCASICARTVLVESKDELSPADFIGCGVVGITAGASTPDCTIKEVVTYMNDNDNIQPIADTTEAQATPAEQATPVESAAPVEPATPVESSAPAEEPQEMIDSGADVNFTTAFEQTMVSIRPGQTVNGKIVQIREEEVCVNIGYKSDGIVKRSDLVGDGELKIGDEIEVEVVKVNDGEGNVILSQRNIINRKNWDAISTAFDNGEFVGGVGKEAVKGGLLATVMGIRTFIPASQLSLRYVEKIEDFVGKDMKLKIIEVDKQKKRIVASAKAVLIEEESMRKKQIWGKLTVGEVITGTVRRLTDFGAFVDIGGVDGLVHVADLSWGRVKHPSDVVAVNQEIQVKIMNVDEEKERVSLGYKQLQPKPWDVAGERYPAGAIVTGKVVRIVNFGAFVELEPGLDGLVHISQCAPTRIDKVEDAVTVGDYVRVKILSIEPDNKRISLSIRDAMSEEEGQYEIPVEDTSEEPTAYVEADPDSMEEPQDEEPEAEAVQTEEAGDEVQPE